MRRISSLTLTLFLVGSISACGDDSAVTTAPPVAVDVSVTFASGAVTVTVDGAAASGHVAVPLGSEVRLTVTSDVADEVHLHTYDLMVELEEGVPGVIDFTASIAGIFEVELEASAVPLIELEVG